MTRDTSKKLRAQAICAEIESFLNANPGGGGNQEAFHKITSLGRQLKWLCNSTTEKVDTLLNYAEMLYSPRKHARWDAPGISGVDQLRGFILQDIMSIQTIVGRMSELD